MDSSDDEKELTDDDLWQVAWNIIYLLTAVAITNEFVKILG